MIIPNISDSNWRSKVVSTALDYANYTWTPTDYNIYHGYDSDRILVNTPDAGYVGVKYDCGWWKVNQDNRGLPYNWGGCSTIDDFAKGIEEGKYAGNVPDFRDNGVSRKCVGVDCSGLVTICWGISKKLSSNTIPQIAAPLTSSDALLPGDVILKPGSHVMIFVEFSDIEKTQAKIVDATRSTGKVSLRTVSLTDLLSRGFLGYRKSTTC